MKVLYTQVATQGLPAGYPVVLAEPTSEHLIAAAMVKGNVGSMRYAKPLHSEEVIMFSPMELGDYHPKDPRVTGPYAIDRNYKVDYDTTKHNIRVMFVKGEYPSASLLFCIDPRIKYMVGEHYPMTVLKVNVAWPKWVALETKEMIQATIKEHASTIFPGAVIELLDGSDW